MFPSPNGQGVTDCPIQSSFFYLEPSFVFPTNCQQNSQIKEVRRVKKARGGPAPKTGQAQASQGDKKFESYVTYLHSKRLCNFSLNVPIPTKLAKLT